MWSPCRPAPDSVPQPPTRRVGDIDQKLKHALAEAERLRSERIPRGTPLSPDSRPPGLGKEPRCPGDQVQVPAPSHVSHSRGRAAARSPGRRFGGRSAESQGRSLERPERPGSRPSGPDLYSRRQSETASRNSAARARASYSLWSRSWSSTLRCHEIPGSRLVRKGPLAGEESSERPRVGPGQGLGRWPVCGAQGWTRRRTLEREGAPSD